MTAYDRFAQYYDDYYEPIVDYEGDAEFVAEAFARFGKAGPVRRVLDLGCGTGAHAARLAKAGSEITGVDLSPQLVAIARAKVPGAAFFELDFTRALPEGRFDAAVCLFAAWCYATRDEDAARLLALLRARLPRGAPFVFEFWSPYGWEPSHNWGEAELSDGRRLVRLTRPRLPIRDDVYEFTFEHFVLRGDALDDHFFETHRLRLRTPAQTEALLRAHGFEVVAFTRGDRDGKSFEQPLPDALRVMCIARVA